MHRKAMLQGLVGAILTAAVTFALPEELRLPLLAGLLWLTAGIYVGMGAMHGDKHLRTQAVAGLPIAAGALLSVMSPWFLLAGWLAHPLWDLAHHRGVVKTHIHPATVGFCLVYDVLVAGLVAVVAWM